MFKNVIVVQIDSVLNYPPTLALLEKLSDLEVNITLISTHTGHLVQNALPRSVKLVNVGKPYVNLRSSFLKLVDLFFIRKKVWGAIDSVYNEETILWIMSNISIKHMGMKIINYRYNLHIF